METKYHVDISSPPDREKLVAEISFNNCQWAELNQEGTELQLEFYPRPDGKPWNISLQAVEEALKAAKERLTG